MLGMTMDRDGFLKMFRGRAMVVTQLPPGYGRELATRVNEASGRRDVSLRTAAEHLALFELLVKDADVVLPARSWRCVMGAGSRPPRAGRSRTTSGPRGKDEFFDGDMYMVHVTRSSDSRPDTRTPADIGRQLPDRGVAHRS